MKHYTHKVNSKVYGFYSLDKAKLFIEDWEYLEEMTDELFSEYQQGPKGIGYAWTTEGWVLDIDKLKQDQLTEIPHRIESLNNERGALLQAMQMKSLLGKLEEAKELAQMVEDMDVQIKELEEVLNEQADT